MMHSWIAVLLATSSGLLAAISQLMLKKSAMKKYEKKYQEYLNFNVIISYGILFCTTLINMQAMVYLPYKLMPIIGTASYIFVVLISATILKEKVTLKKACGIVLILLGIIVFNIGGK